MRSKQWLGLGGLLVALWGVLLPPVSVVFPCPTETPTASDTVLFQDDFATYSNRWREDKTAKAFVAYQDEALVMQVVSPGVRIWSVPDFTLPLEDYRIQVTVDMQDSSPDAWAGILVNYQDDENFYAFLLSSSGDWKWVQQRAGDWIDATLEESIGRELQTPIRLLRVDMTGKTAHFFVDDHLLGTAAVEVSGGLFGLLVQAGKGYSDVSFDEFVVTDITEYGRSD